MYTYRIFAYQALHATKYSYNDIIEYSPEDTTGTLTKGLLVTAHFTHGIKIVEVPIYSQQVRILDSGPLSPEVQMFLDQILIYLQLRPKPNVSARATN